MSDAGERTPLLEALPRDPRHLVAAVSGLILHRLFVGRSPSLRRRRASTTSNVGRCHACSIGSSPATRRRSTRPDRSTAASSASVATTRCSRAARFGITGSPRGSASASPRTSRRVPRRPLGLRVPCGRSLALARCRAGRIGVRAHFGIGFDPADVPRDAFLVAGEAWGRARRGTVDPETCGVSGSASPAPVPGQQRGPRPGRPQQARDARRGTSGGSRVAWRPARRSRSRPRRGSTRSPR